MHDLKWIRENPDAFDEGLKNRGLEPQAGAILKLDEDRRAAVTRLQDMQARRNAASKEIGKAKGKGGDPAKAEALMREVAELKEGMQAAEEEEKRLSADLQSRLQSLPNTPLEDVPVGDESANKVLRTWGKKPTMKFEPKQHFDLGEALGQMDFEAAARMSGARFVVLKGALARLERAIGQFMLDLQTREHGYTEVSPPLLVKDPALFGTAQLPKFEADLFKATSIVPGALAKAIHDDLGGITEGRISLVAPTSQPLIQLEIENAIRNTEGNRLFLVPTAEVPLTNLVRESILAESDLPRRVAALTPCFRSEAGAAGKDTRGMVRQHQFWKVELVSITTPEQSLDELERMTSCAEEVLKRLKLPYRVVVLSTGDMGFSARKTYDLEVWLPGQGTYREISSCSVCGDFQARRMQARYRPAEGKDVRYVHTLNGSGLAVGRTLIAVLENYQQADGSVKVPEVLKPYMGGISRISAGELDGAA